MTLLAFVFGLITRLLNFRFTFTFGLRFFETDEEEIAISERSLDGFGLFGLFYTIFVDEAEVLEAPLFLNFRSGLK